MHLAKNYYTQIIYLKVFVSMHFKLAEDCKNKIKVKMIKNKRLTNKNCKSCIL